ncbi:MAG: hypothetical protein ABFD15_06075 [Methanofastidiosum sp.]
MSLFAVDRLEVIAIAEYILENIVKEREKMFERSVEHVMKEKKEKFLFFKRKPITREEAEKRVMSFVGALDYLPFHLAYRRKEAEKISNIINACKMSEERTIQLDRDDAALFGKWKDALTEEKLNKKNKPGENE